MKSNFTVQHVLGRFLISRVEPQAGLKRDLKKRRLGEVDTDIVY